MNIKKILVLVMALVMAVSACAPAIYAFDRDDVKLDKVEEKATELKVTIEEIAKYVAENYEQAYADGYAYALENGFVDEAVAALDEAIAVLEGVDLETLEVTNELKAQLANELDACVDTLGDLKGLLANNEIADFDGLVIALVALEAELDAHLVNLGNIYANADAEIEAVKGEVKRVLNKIDAMIKETLNKVHDYLVAKLQPYFEQVRKIANITREVYNNIVEAIVTINTTIVRIHTILVEANEIVLDTIEKVEAAIEMAVETYTQIADILVTVYGKLDITPELTNRILNRVRGFVLAHKGEIKVAALHVKELMRDVYHDVLDMYGESDNAFVVTYEIFKKVANLLVKVNSKVYGAFYGAVNGNYVLGTDSYYVALGQAGYAGALAEMILLGDKYSHFELDEDYLEALKGADLVTVDFSDDTLYEFINDQVIGLVAGLARENSTFMNWYHNEGIVGTTIRSEMEKLELDINAKPEELNWSKYLNDRRIADLEAALAEIRHQVIHVGVPETYEFDLGTVILDVLAENMGGRLPGLKIDLVLDVPVADIVVFAIENALYKYAELVADVNATLGNIYEAAPEATVVINGFANPLTAIAADLEAIGVDVKAGELALEVVVEALNFQLYSCAVVNENTVFVHGYSANDIYEAINFRCGHDYDNCEDVVCNICGEERVAPEHVFINYVANGDATCAKNETQTAKCENCDLTHTKDVENSKLPHDWKDATCTSPKTCKNCNATEGKPIEHTYGEWETTKQPTDLEEGLRVKTCKVCGHKLEEPIAKIDPKLSPIAIIAIVVVASVVVCGASFGIYTYLKKKNEG
jgi:hypothetical protein